MRRCCLALRSVHEFQENGVSRVSIYDLSSFSSLRLINVRASLCRPNFALYVLPILMTSHFPIPQNVYELICQRISSSFCHRTFASESLISADPTYDYADYLH